MVVSALVKTLGLVVGFCLFLTRHGYILPGEQGSNSLPEAWGNQIIEKSKDDPAFKALPQGTFRNKNTFGAGPVKERLAGSNQQRAWSINPRSDNLKGGKFHLPNRQPTTTSPYVPGEPAAAFNLRTLSGLLEYPSPQLPQGHPVIVHVHDNRSAFVEATWNDADSLQSLVTNAPNDTHFVFMSTADNATADVLWMKSQLDGALTVYQPWLSPGIASRLHYVTTPVWQLGNWMPYLLKYWACTGNGCGYDQVVFQTSNGEGVSTDMLVAKRLDAHYDWLPSPVSVIGNQSVEMVPGGNGCQASKRVKGKVALVSSEGDCSYYTKVSNMQTSGARAVLVYSRPGQPIMDMNCQEDECDTQLSIPGSMIHYNQALLQKLQLQEAVSTNVTYQNTPSDNFYFAIDEKGLLSEVGWFLYPSLQFLVWQAQWFEYKVGLNQRLASPDTVVFTVFNSTTMQGDPGIVVNITLPSDLRTYSTLELDMSLSCPGERDETCAEWDHTVHLLVCCNQTSPLCDMELGRWITPFRRRIGRWLTTVSPLSPLLSSNQCSFTMNTVPWAKPWVPSLNLRMSGHFKNKGEEEASLRPYQIIPIYAGQQTFNKSYNDHFKPKLFNVSATDKKVEVVSVITGHGSDENNCCEFCVTSHHLVVNNDTDQTFNRTFDSAGTQLGCAEHVPLGVEPNEHGTWLYGRGGWCDGQQVDPWVIDITPLVSVGSNNITYYGWFNGTDPDPKENPGYIIMYSYLVFYESP